MYGIVVGEQLGWRATGMNGAAIAIKAAKSGMKAAAATESNVARAI
jgi:hypothetical protein